MYVQVGNIDNRLQVLAKDKYIFFYSFKFIIENNI